MPKPRLLIVGDFAKHSGFARVNEALAAHLRDRWDIAVLAVNYHGDYTPLQAHYRLYPAWIGGDAHGWGRTAKIVRYEQPDAVLIVADPWHAGKYMENLAQLDPQPPCVLYTPVDATGIPVKHGPWLSRYQTVVAYTQFGADVLRRAGCAAPTQIVPHGIDRELFRPIPRDEARRAVGVTDLDLFLVLVIDRNQPRKRLDIAFEAFAQFAADKPEARLVYHGAEDDQGWDLAEMALDLGITDKYFLTAEGITPLSGVDSRQLAYLYSMCDVKLSTTSGEGWGLTTMEAMACGVPCIAPDYAALGEWGPGGMYLVDAPTRTRHVKINTVGRVPRTEDVVAALDDLYHHPDRRAELARAGLELVSHPRYDWANIADQFDVVLRRAWHSGCGQRAAFVQAEVEAEVAV